MTYCCVGIIWDATWWTRPSNHVEQTGCFFWHKYHRLFRVKIAVVLSLFWHKKHTEDCFCFLAGLPTGSLDYYYAMQVQLGKALLGFFFFFKVLPFWIYKEMPVSHDRTVFLIWTRGKNFHFQWNGHHYQDQVVEEVKKISQNETSFSVLFFNN